MNEDEWKNFFINAEFSLKDAEKIASAFTRENIKLNMVPGLSLGHMHRLQFTVGDCIKVQRACKEELLRRKTQRPQNCQKTLEVSSGLKLPDMLLIDDEWKEHLRTTNLNLRQSYYVAWSNCQNVKLAFKSLMKEIHVFFESHYLEMNDITTKKDILYQLWNKQPKNSDTSYKAEKINVRTSVVDFVISREVNMSDELLSEIHRTTATSKITKTGYQHIYLKGDTTDIAAWEDDPDDVLTQLETCQIAKNLECQSMLGPHTKNSTEISDNATMLDVLIFCFDHTICHRLAVYLGLVFMDDILDEANIETNKETVFLLLNNKKSKLYTLLQAYANRQFICGRHNVCLTSNFFIFTNMKAKIKAVIDNNSDRDLFLSLSDYSMINVKINKDHSILDYITALAEILDSILNCDSHIKAVYRLHVFADKKKFHSVKLPLISVIPWHILKFFAAIVSSLPENRRPLSPSKI